MLKFAYIIMAHDNPYQLMKLIRLLDDEYNDLYIHIDKKSISKMHYDFKSCAKSAHIEVYSEYDIVWGGISQTECQMYMLRQALKKYHDYYHLLSGKDLPLKKNDYIQEFFQKNYGKEFVFFENKYPVEKESAVRYHFFGIPRNISDEGRRRLITNLENISMLIQRIFRVRRKFYCGDNWYSITSKLATDFSTNEKKMLRKVRFANNSDELILQTFLWTRLNDYSLYYTGFDENHISIMRFIDWERGNPYVWRKSNYTELVESPYLWARKFDENVDSDIIDMLVEYLLN